MYGHSRGKARFTLFLSSPLHLSLQESWLLLRTFLNFPFKNLFKIFLLYKLLQPSCLFHPISSTFPFNLLELSFQTYQTFPPNFFAFSCQSFNLPIFYFKPSWNPLAAFLTFPSTFLTFGQNLLNFSFVSSWTFLSTFLLSFYPSWLFHPSFLNFSSNLLLTSLSIFSNTYYPPPPSVLSLTYPFQNSLN